MRKRKRNQSLASEKMVTRRGELHLSTDLWVAVAEFLNKHDLARLSFLNTNFALIAWHGVIHLYKERYSEFKLDFIIENQKYDLKVFRLVNQQIQYYDNHYYTLFDTSYIPLFEAIHAKDSQRAIAFIRAKLAGRDNVTDRVFYQKNAWGESVITLAGQYGLEEFLKFCFEELILNEENINAGNYALIRLYNYPTILADLDSEMSVDALWLFACAYLCHQTEICRALESKPKWDIYWHSKKNMNLSLIGALLGSIDLVRAALNGLTTGEAWRQADKEKYYKEAQLYVNERDFCFGAIGIAGISNNSQIINHLISLYRQGNYPIQATLPFFYIHSRNSVLLREFYNYAARTDYTIEMSAPSPLDSKFLNIDCDFNLSALGAAIIKNWLEGVKIIVDSGLSLQVDECEYALKDGSVSVESHVTNYLGIAVRWERLEIIRYLLDHGADPNGFRNPTIKEPPPIFYAIRNNNLEIVMLLVEYGASLEIKNSEEKAADCFPLITAILQENNDIQKFILDRLGIKRALSQLHSIKSFFIDGKGRDRHLILNYYHRLSKNSALLPAQARVSTEQKFLSGKLIAWSSLPASLWAFCGLFITKTELMKVLLVNKSFCNWISESIIHQACLIEPVPSSYIKMCRQVRQGLLYAERYYTLIKPAYIPLFQYVEQNNLQAAQAFIEQRINDPDFFDMLFFQKDCFGNTVLTLANQLGFQSFLDYCFMILLEQAPMLSPLRIIKIVDYYRVFNRPEFSMCSEALWWFACAFVCRQQSVCDDILKKPAWNKFWNEDIDNLLRIACMLSSVNLANYFLAGISGDDTKLIVSAEEDDPFRFYHYTPNIHLPLSIAIMSKNLEIIDLLRKYTHENHELIFYFIENKNLSGLQLCWKAFRNKLRNFSKKTNLPHSIYRIYTSHVLIPLSLAIIKNWLAGVQFLIDKGFSPNITKTSDGFDGEVIAHPLALAAELNRTEIAAYLLTHDADVNDGGYSYHGNHPIFYAIKNDNLKMVQLLAEHHADFNIVDDYTIAIHKYPLVSAVLYQRNDIIAFIIKKIGIPAGITQLKTVLQKSSLLLAEEERLIKKALRELQPAKKGYELFPSPQDSPQPTPINIKAHEF
jgi:ankyrin repeat protein